MQSLSNSFQHANLTDHLRYRNVKRNPPSRGLGKVALAVIRRVVFPGQSASQRVGISPTRGGQYLLVGFIPSSQEVSDTARGISQEPLEPGSGLEEHHLGPGEIENPSVLDCLLSAAAY